MAIARYKQIMSKKVSSLSYCISHKLRLAVSNFLSPLHTSNRGVEREFEILQMHPSLLLRWQLDLIYDFPLLRVTDARQVKPIGQLIS